MKNKKAAVIFCLMAILGIILSGCTSDRETVKAQSKEMPCPDLNLPMLKVEQNQFDTKLFSITPRIGAMSEIVLPNNIVEDEDELNVINYKIGQNEGEQANRHYCDPWNLKKLTTDTEGNITGEEKFAVLLEFNETKKLDSTKCYQK
jgi:hypothetical protein